MTMRYYLSAIIIAILVVFTCSSGVFAEIHVRGSVSRTEVATETDNVETTSETTIHNYSLSFQKKLTNTIMLNGDIRWANSTVDNDGEVTKTKNAYPVFTLSYRPPAQYNIRFGFNRTDSSPSNGEHITTENLHAGFSLPPSRFPSLNLNYNRSTTEDHAAVQQMNSINTRLNLTTDHGFTYREVSTRVNYAFGLTTLEDKVGSTTTETPSHLATVSMSRRFLDDKLMVSTNFGLSMSETTTESLGSASRFEQALGPSSGLESEAPADPTLVTLVSEPQFIDNDRSTVVTPSTDPAIDLSKSNWNMGLGFTGPTKIHSLNLYIASSLLTATIKLYNFGWRIYSSDDNVSWSSVAISSSSYNAVFRRFEFDFAEKSATYFKVVNTNNPSVFGDMEATEVEAIGYALSTPQESYTVSTARDFSGLTLSYTPFDRLNLGMSINLDSTETESDSSSSYGVKNSRYGLNARYTVVPRYLIFATTYSSLKSAPSNADENVTNSYTGTFSSTPLETINASLSYLFSEALTGGTLQSEQSSINTSVFLALYTGIDLNLGATVSSTEAPASGSESESRSHRWGLKLKPWKPLTVIINSSNATNDSTQDGVSNTTTSKNLDVNVSYTPSRKIYMSANFDIEPEASEVYSLTWIPTRSIQGSFRYNSSEESSGMSTDLSWRPFKPVSLHSGYSITWVDNETSDQVKTVYARASVRF